MPQTDQGADNRPNILLILADDMGYTDIGSFGSEIATPNLDALAFEGVRFTNFHVAPSCAPTRAMLMSGMTSREAGVRQHNDPLRTDVAALPERLAAAGYHTYMAGKWNLGIQAHEGPRARGFESSYALLPAGDNHLGGSNFPARDAAYRENGEPVEALPEDWFSSRLYTDKLIEYIDANRGDGRPWFGYLAFTAPHWPLQAPDDWIDRYAGRYEEGYDVLREARVAKAEALGVLPEGLSLDTYRGRARAWADLSEEERRVSARAMEIYAAMVENMDFHVGRVIDYLERTDSLDDTVILFMSDNGASGSTSSLVPTTIPRTDWDSSLPNMGREGSWIAYGPGWGEAATAPYREMKGSLHSGGTLAAAFVRHDSVADRGGTDGAYLTVMDVLPTLVEIAGGSQPSTEFLGRQVRPLRGRSFWGRIQGDVAAVHDETEAIPWMTSNTRRALVRWPWKIVTGASGPESQREAPHPWLLFNLADDPGETTDLTGRYPELRSELIERWKDYGRLVNAPERRE